MRLNIEVIGILEWSPPRLLSFLVGPLSSLNGRFRCNGSSVSSLCSSSSTLGAFPILCYVGILNSEQCRYMIYLPSPFPSTYCRRFCSCLSSHVQSFRRNWQRHPMDRRYQLVPVHSPNGPVKNSEKFSNNLQSLQMDTMRTNCTTF